jgi:hypothetical protein
MSKSNALYQMIPGNPHIVAWKPSNTPQGVISGSIRPLTNKDYTNDTIYKIGSKRPLHIYRNGKNIANQRFVNSSVVSNGIMQTIDAPSLSTTTPNKNDGISLCVSESIPNYNLTDNPSSITCSSSFCCNPQYKAKRMSYSANTNKKNGYYTNTNQYLYQRNKTFSQNSFHYLNTKDDIQVKSTATISQIKSASKPGGSLSTWNNYKYISNNNEISENIDACSKNIMYNPNNYLYAKQGAVSDRTRLLNLIQSSLLHK